MILRGQIFWGVATLSCALVSMRPSVAWAEDEASLRQRVQRLYGEGLELYQEGRFRDAVGRFEDAHALVADPRLMYNIARSYEGAGDVDRGTLRYFRCINDPKTDDALRARALERVQALEQARQRHEWFDRPPQTSLESSRTARRENASPSSWLGTSKWLSAGLGLGLLGGGGALLAVNGANESGPSRGAETAGLALLSAGGVLAVMSAVLFVIDGGRTTSSGTRTGRLRGDVSVAMGLAPGRGGGTLLLVTPF